MGIEGEDLEFDTTNSLEAQWSLNQKDNDRNKRVKNRKKTHSTMVQSVIELL